MIEKDYLSGKRILIVDDEEDVLNSLEELLPMCQVLRAKSYDDAKIILEREPLDLVILDIMGVDGFKLLEFARKRTIIAVMLTANAFTVENTIRSIKEGAASYIPKEELANIAVFLNDVFEAKYRGKNFWWRWLERMDKYYVRRFGIEWKKRDKEFWEKFYSQ